MGHKHWAQMDRLVRGEPCQGGGLVEGVVHGALCDVQS